MVGMKKIQNDTQLTDKIMQQCVKQNDDGTYIVKPSGTNKYGYLLFDKEAEKRWWMVKFYRDMKKPISKIRSIMADPNYNLTEDLNSIIDVMKAEIATLEEDIVAAQNMRDTGITPVVINELMGGENQSYTDAKELASMISGTIADAESETDDDGDSLLTDKEAEVVANNILAIYEYKKKGLPYQSAVVQEAVNRFYNIVKIKISTSKAAYGGFILLFLPDGMIGKPLDNYFGKGTAQFLYEAFLFHHHSLPDDDTTNIEKTYAEIEHCIKSGYYYNSQETQAQIKALFKTLIPPEIEKSGVVKQMLVSYKKNFLSNMGKQPKTEVEKTEYKYLMDAISYYIDNYKENENE